ncbi:MAG: gliding motility-associated C-terminal domain-containing protein, partial [Bacteroidota bacterium]
ANGCIDQDSVEVVFQEKHAVDLGPDVLVCPNVPVSLDATTEDATSYQWQDGMTMAVRSEVTPQLYWVDVKKGLCTVRDTLVLDNHPAPEVPNILGTAVVCPGVEEVLYESDQKNFTAYQWFVVGGTLMATEQDQMRVSWGQASNNALVGLAVIDSLSCTSDTTLLPVRINTRLEPPMPLGDSMVCVNQKDGVIYYVPETNGSVYRWLVDGDETSGRDELSQTQLNWQGPGTYQLQVVETSITPDTACSGISPPLDVTVFVDSAKINLIRVTTAPTNDAEIQVIWNVDHPSRFEGELQLTRRAASSEDLVVELAPVLESFQDIGLSTGNTTYTYEISARNKCAESLATRMHESILLSGQGNEEKGLVTLQWSNYIGWEASARYELWRRLDREEDFSWLSNLDGATLRFADTLATDGFEHQYRVRASGNGEDEFSWSNIIDLSFAHELIIPNVFTPNGDKINDRFEIENIGLYESNVLEVFNRQGTIVYRSAGYRNQWDGKDVPSGLYFYRLTIANLDLVYNGPLTLLR